MKRYIVFLVFCFLWFSHSAQVISFDDARQKAQEFFFETDKTPQTLKSSTAVKVDTFATYYTTSEYQLKSAGQTKEPAFYIFNRTDKPGFVIVSADKRIRDIIAYSNSNSFCDPNPGLKTLLKQYVVEISYAKEKNINVNTNDSKYSLAANGEWLVEAIKDIKWNQSPSPYNSSCPPHNSSTHSLTGCAATAMAQIIYSYKYPRKGRGSHEYVSPFGSESADFEKISYKYELMKDKPEENIDNIEISRLLYDCGVAIETKYGLNYSGVSSASLIKKALETYFLYKNCTIKDRTFRSDANWKQLIKNEINNNRPICYFARDPDNIMNPWDPEGGHVFLIYGYNDKDQYRINWGWGGCSDDYYSLDLLQPKVDCPDYNFNKYKFGWGHKMIIGIEPDDNTPPTAIKMECTQDINTNFIITFNEALKSIIKETILLKGEKSGTHDFSFSYDIENHKLTIDPINDFQNSEKVTVTLKSTITDMAGNLLDGDSNGIEGPPDYIYEFTTTGFTHDYAVKSLSVSNKSPKLGEKIDVTAIIQNVGKEEVSENQTITFYDNGSKVDSYSATASLAIGGESTKVFKWTTTGGKHILKVELDRANDENALNNSKQLTAIISDMGNFVVDGELNLELNVTVTPGKFSILSFLLKLKNQLTNLKSSDLTSAKIQNTTTTESITSVSAKGEKGHWVLLKDGTAVSLSEGVEKPYNFNVIAPTGTSPGLYNAGIEFTSADSSIITKIDLNINVIESTTGFAAYEYWFDGEYDSRKYNEINSPNIFELNTGLSTTGLNSGLHSFHFRVLDKDGQWSSVTSEFFHKLPLSSGVSSKIIAYEYWFNNDYNSRESVSIRGRQTVSTLDEIDLSSVSAGLHNFHIRYLDNAGQWSSVVSEFFHKLPASATGERKITAYEYWYDSDYAGKITVPVTPEQIFSLNGGLDAVALSNGLHSYHVRYKDDAGQWSSVVSEFFHKLPVSSAQENLINAYRYWFNHDKENMQFINLVTPVNPYELIRDISVSGLPSGNNTIHFQFRDTRQAWSSVVTDTFNYESLLVQEIALKTGWNIFSVGLQPQNSRLDMVSQKLINTGSLVKVQDEGGNSFEDLGVNGGWQNNIGTISVTEGYKIKVNRNDTLKVSGSPVTYPYAIPLKKGWNIAGYPQQTDFSGMNLVQQLADKGTLIKVQDEGGNSIEDWGIYGSWQNNIGNFMAGEGYKIKMSADDTLWIYENYPNSSAVLPEFAGTTHFKRAFEGHGFDHMNINLVGLPTNVFNAGDELAVFDGANCVGAVALTLNHLQNRNVSIAASSTDSQGLPGFVEGKPIILRLWSSKIKKEFSVVPEIVKGTSTFIKNETTVASLEKFVITALDDLFASDQPEINCYPNPFSDEITVEISLFDDTVVEIEVLNQQGQKVKSIAAGELLNRGVHRLTWDGTNAGKNKVAPGIYLIRMKINDMVYYRKVVYSK